MQDGRQKLIIDDSPLPERGPEPGRALRMRRVQVVSLSVLLVIVGSALAGAYNPRQHSSRLSLAGLDVRVTYTTHARFQQTDIISVTFGNNTGRPVDSIHVAVDTGYMAGFGETQINPEPEFPFESVLPQVPVGEFREVRVEARGNRSGRHEGELTISVRGDTARVHLSTFIFP